MANVIFYVNKKFSYDARNSNKKRVERLSSTAELGFNGLVTTIPKVLSQTRNILSVPSL